jgi:nitronate monooxygenase
MPVPELFRGRLALPVLGAPMFLASGPELVIAQCRAGVPGAFPSINARSPEILDQWLTRIRGELESAPPARPETPVAPFGVNLIVHRTNPRLAADLEVVVRHRVPWVVTSVGKPAEVVPRVHGYGGLVFHDVTTLEHARKAIAAGVDGLILVCAGAGGHGGTLSPFAFVAEVREFWLGPLALAGAISTGRAVRAAEILGADFAYLGTRFLASHEANAAAGHKQMIVDHAAADIVYTAAISGVPGNYLRPSLAACGQDPQSLPAAGDQPLKALFQSEAPGPKAWKDIWSAGQGIGAIHEVRPVAEIVAQLCTEYAAACRLPSGGGFQATAHASGGKGGSDLETGG